MNREKKNKNQKIVGLVYKYTSPSGKVYIGQTTNESHRRRTWFCTKRRYAGAAIEHARLKYGPENFEYTVLYKGEFDSFEEALSVLDEREKYYIDVYDSLKNGYNNTNGGLFPDYGIQTQLNGRAINQERTIDSVYHRRRMYPKHTKNEIQQLRKKTNRDKGRWHKVNQFTLDGKLIRTFSSASEAQEFGLGHYANIRRACKTLGNYNGYAWRFAEDGDKLKMKPPKQKAPKKEYVCKGRPTKAVVKCNKNGDILKSYNSIKEAMADNGIKYCSNISDCLSGLKRTAGGFVWKYKKDIAYGDVC